MDRFISTNSIDVYIIKVNYPFIYQFYLQTSNGNNFIYSIYI
jgi:hypothetical protein